MSLEVALQANTNAILQLIDTINRRMGGTPAVREGEEMPAPIEAPKAKAPTLGTGSTPGPAPESSAVTFDVLRDLVLSVSREKGRDVAAGVLAQFGAKKLPEVQPETYPQLYQALKAA